MFRAVFQATHGTDEFRRLGSQEGWDEFSSSPTLYEVVAAADAEQLESATC
jgi:hypothetical protein